MPHRRGPARILDVDLELGVSLGVAIAGDGDIDEAQLMQQADAAMYAAKRAGRGRISLYDGTMADTDWPRD